jgi:hypothetical protein
MWAFLQEQLRFQKDPCRLPSIMAAVMVPAAFYFSIRHISSIDQDKPVMLLLWLVLLFFVKRQVDSNHNHPLTDILLILWSAFAVTIKLSALPVLLIPIYLIISRWIAGQKRFVYLSLFLVFFLLLPWFIRSVVLSGYLVFPFAALDLFSFDWKIPKHIVEYIQLVTTAFARVWFTDIDYVLSLPFKDWVRLWFVRIPLFFHLILFLGLFGNIIFFLHGLRANRDRIQRIFLPSLFIIAIFFWFINAPDYRFGLGFLVPAAVLPLVNFISHFLQKVHPKWRCYLYRIVNRASKSRQDHFRPDFIIAHQPRFPLFDAHPGCCQTLHLRSTIT